MIEVDGAATTRREQIANTGGSRPDWLPPADIIETREAFEISLEICGVSRDEIVVGLEDDRLTVSGVRLTDTEERVCHYRERQRGRFVRAFSFRTPVDDERIEARLADGVLFLTIPKRRPMRIPLA